MEINDKKLKRTSKTINFFISFILAIFLILLAERVIYDLDSAINSPDESEFVEKKTTYELDKETTELREKIDGLRDQERNFKKLYRAILDQKQAEQESFDNWIKTRTSTSDPNQDKEVLARVAKIDELQKTALQWNAKSDSINEIIRGYNQQVWENQEMSSKSYSRTQQQYQKAFGKYQLKVFGIRLLFTAPILILGIFFFLKKRKHKFAPLFMGFSLFSVYVFFFGLVPYLPSFGGYIRYTVGVLLTLGLGYYAIKRIRAYMDQKQAELKESSTKRATKLESEIVEKAFQNHICPSCGKDFLLKQWERVEGIDQKSLRPTSAYCRHCGMQLFKKCNNCQQENYAHQAFCVSCGDKLNKKEETVEETISEN